MTKTILLATFLLSTAANAGGKAWGHIEARKLFWSNIPAYIDLTGPDLSYAVDAEINIPILRRFSLMSGAEGAGISEYFTQASGRAGLNYAFPNGVDMGVYHKSSHSFDRRNEGKWRFYSENYVFIRYNFGSRPE